MLFVKSNDLTKRRALLSRTFKHSMIETSQGKIALWDSKPGFKNDDPTIVFIHAHCANKEFFEKQLNSPFFANYRLIALDLPGYGESEPPKDPEKVYSFPGFASVVKEVIHLMELNNIVIVGWSLGGHVALEIAPRLPQLKGLLITGAPPIEISPNGLSRGFKAADPKVLACFGKGNLSYEEAQLLATVSGYNFTKEKEFIVDAVLETDEGAKTIYPRSIMLGVGQNELKIVNEWPHPIAVIAGEKDAGINNDYIINEVKFKNLWEGQVHVIPNAGHAAFMEDPEKFNLILHRFVQNIFNTSAIENQTVENGVNKKMKKSQTYQDEKKIIGIKTRTNNQLEINSLEGKIFPLVKQYFHQNVVSRIPNRVQPGTTFCIYTDYESDHQGDYTYFIGEEVTSFDGTPTDLETLIIPGQKYTKFTNGPGSMPDVIRKPWQQIWQMTPAELGGTRSYITDFEVYDERAADHQNIILDLYIGIES
jgi:pimeloyl-ACP methyl ester carboxylesterase/predicted transcriptional regulator YdeE